MSTFKKVTAVTAVLAISGLTAIKAQAVPSASATGLASMKVRAPITLQKTKDLSFAEVDAGAVAEVVAPGDAGAAAFNVGGKSGTAFNVLPISSITMSKTGVASPSADQQIAVTNFQHDGAGQTIPYSLHVGATRAELSATQDSGDYEGVFTVTVTY